MKRFGIALLYALGGFFVATAASYFLIGQFSSSTHDRSVEAAMTSALIWGPLGAMAAFVVGVARAGHRAARPRGGG